MSMFPFFNPQLKNIASDNKMRESSTVAEKQFSTITQADEYRNKTDLDVAQIITADYLKNPFKPWWTKINRAIYGEILSALDTGEYDPNEYILPINSNYMRSILEYKLANFIGQTYDLTTIIRAGYTGIVTDESINLTLWSNYIQQKINDFFRSDDARMFLQDGLLYDAGFLQVSWKTQKFCLSNNVIDAKDIMIESIDPYSFFPSASSTNIQDCTYIYIVKRTTFTALQGNPDIVKNNRYQDLLGLMGQGWDSLLDYTIIKDYLFFNPAELIDWDGDKVDFTTKYQKFVDKSDKKVKLLITYYIGHHWIDEEVVDMAYYPFVDLMPYKNNRYFWTMPSFRTFFDAQAVVARGSTIIATQMELLQKPMTLINKKSGISPQAYETYRKVINTVLEVDGDTALEQCIYQVPPPTIPKELMEAIDISRQQLQTESGVNPIMTGGGAYSGSNSGAISALINQANKVNLLFQHNLNSAVTKLGKLILNMYRCKVVGNHEAYIKDNNPNSALHGMNVDLKTDFLRKYELDVYLNSHPKNQNDKIQEFQALIQIQNLAKTYPNNPTLVSPQEMITAAPVGAIKEQMLARVVEQDYAITKAKSTEIMQLVVDSIKINSQNQQGQSPIPPEKILDIIASIINNQLPLPTAQQIVSQLQAQGSAGQMSQEGQGSSANQNSNNGGNING